MLYQINSDGTITGAGVAPLTGLPSSLTFEANGFSVDQGQVIPLQAVASQILETTLNQQACTIRVYFKDLQIPAAVEIPTTSLVFESLRVCFLDLYVNDALVIGGVRCMDRNLIVRNRYLGFVGDLSFVDTQGTQFPTGPQDPDIDGLGTRYILTYWPKLP